MFCTTNLLSIETKQSEINSVKLHSQNAPNKLPNLGKIDSSFSGVYQCANEEI